MAKTPRKTDRHPGITKKAKVKTLIPYAGKPKGNESHGATYGAKHRKRTTP